MNENILHKNDNYFLILENPIHSYHGNHWFHFGEHFISRANELKQLATLPQNSSLYLLSNNDKFLNFVTPFTFFLMIITCWYPNIGRISLLKLKNRHLSPSIMEHYEINEKVQISAFPTEFVYQHGLNIKDRFSQKRNPEVLDYYEGTVVGGIGDYPISSFNWFKTVEDRDHIKKNIDAVCHGSTEFDQQSDPMTSGKRRVVVYQRDQSRRILNLDYLLETLIFYFPASEDWEIFPIHHSEERNPCLLYQIMHKAKVFVSLHGFQFTSLMFLPPYASVIEIFPYKYFKPSYFPLSHQFELNHYWFQSKYKASILLDYISLESCMKDQYCRSFSRNQDVDLSFDEINAIINFILSDSFREFQESNEGSSFLQINS